MSEKAPQYEQHESHGNVVEKTHELPPLHETDHSSREKKISPEETRQLRHEVAEQAISKDEMTRSSNESARHQPSNSYISKHVKLDSFDRTMRSVRKKLPKTEAMFSKVIHAEAVDKVSEVAANTVGRPSAIAGGGIVGLVGLVIVGYYSKRNGFQLSGYEFVLLVIIGMLSGVALEFGRRLVSRLLNR